MKPDEGGKSSRNRTVLVVTAIVTGLLTFMMAMSCLVPFIVWQVKPSQPLDVWIVDKTVPFPDYREHKGLVWILNHDKIVRPGERGGPYRTDADYYGFHPSETESWRSSLMPVGAPKPDLIYLADTYGVYADDYMQRKLSGEFSPKMYGGLTRGDGAALRAALGGGNTLVAEFNVAASPTNDTDRMALGSLLGIRWKGWIGKPFEDLTKGYAVPPWVIRSWEARKGEEWKFSGRGIVLIQDDDRVEVLRDGVEVDARGLDVEWRGAWAKDLGVRDSTPFREYFEWVEPQAGVEILADYHLHLSASGAAVLADLGLPPVFPAVLKYDTTQYHGWYFAGEFTEIPETSPFHMVAGIAWLERLIADDSVDSNTYFYWKVYVPLIRGILADAGKARGAPPEAAPTGPPRIDKRAFGKGFQVRDADGIWKDFPVRGVNLGFAEPGKYFTEFPGEAATYRRWLDSIAAMNANVVRVYTLPPPVFYQALEAHNRENPGRTLYLLQELWPEEHPPEGDYLAEAYRNAYHREIEYGVDAVYGRANIPERKGRAWGLYTVDVSKWLLGWLVGRELESEEVLATDRKNAGATYKGTYVSVETEATPTEAWLAESMDYASKLESGRYGKLHPVSIVSWPTLDPMSHDTEWDPRTGKARKGNDRATVDIAHFAITASMGAGLFGTYHIYPNYPDFIVNEPSYAEYSDSVGMLRYGGYLREFMKGHSKFPALVGEFGLANGTAVAHLSPDGLNHGGVGEKEQGEGIVRMFDAIMREGYAGGVIFEWMDEWAKKTWTTESLMIPYDRHVLWHNTADPEQNYGLLANEVTPPSGPGAVVAGSGNIESLSVSADASWLHINLKLKGAPDLTRERILVGIDTFDRGLGQTAWPRGGTAAASGARRDWGSPPASGLEFLVDVSGPAAANLLVIPGYNAAENRFRSAKASDGVFARINPVVNGEAITRDGRRIPALRFDASAMRRGPLAGSGNMWNIEGDRLSMRIPWTLLNVSDPSSRRVIQDPRTSYLDPASHDALATQATDGIVVYARMSDTATGLPAGAADMEPSQPYLWKGWEEPPAYVERLKESYSIIRDAWAARKGAAGR